MRIGIIGFYGFGNIGDDALFLAAKEMIERRGYSVGWATFEDPAIAKKLGFKGKVVEIFIKKKPVFSLITATDILKELFNTDLLVVGGGALIHDNNPINPLLFFFLSNSLLITKTRGILLGIGASPLRNKWSNFFFRALKSFYGATARSEGEAQIVSSFISTTPASDLVFNKEWSVSRREDASQRTICITLSSHYNKVEYYRPPTTAVQNRRIEAISEAITETFPRDYRILIMPSVREDWNFHEKLYFSLKQKLKQNVSIYLPQTPQEYLEKLSNCYASISIRYHGFLFSILSGVPVLPFIYDFKTESLLVELEREKIKFPRLYTTILGDKMKTTNFLSEFFEDIDFYRRSVLKARRYLKNRSKRNEKLLEEALKCVG